MKKTLIGLSFFIGLFQACNTGDSKPKSIKSYPTPNLRQERIIAVITKRDGTKYLGDPLRSIQKGVKYDSLKGEDVVTVDTIWAVLTTDSTKTTRGKDTVVNNWKVISKDSINTHVENIPIDSLLKKNQ